MTTEPSGSDSPAPSRTQSGTLSNQLRSLLREYYPAALTAYLERWQNGLCRPETRMLLELAPTPAKAARVSLAQIRSALKRAGRKRGIDADAEAIRARNMRLSVLCLTNWQNYR